MTTQQSSLCSVPHYRIMESQIELDEHKILSESQTLLADENQDNVKSSNDLSVLEDAVKILNKIGRTNHARDIQKVLLLLKEQDETQTEATSSSATEIEHVS